MYGAKVYLGLNLKEDTHTVKRVEHIKKNALPGVSFFVAGARLELTTFGL